MNFYNNLLKWDPSKKNRVSQKFSEDERSLESNLWEVEEKLVYEDISEQEHFLESGIFMGVSHMPPFNIEKLSGYSYRLTFLMLGMDKEHIEISQEGSKILVLVHPPFRGEKFQESYEEIHLGIFDVLQPKCPFEFVIEVPKGIALKDSSLEQGLLKLIFEKTDKDEGVMEKRV